MECEFKRQKCRLEKKKGELNFTIFMGVSASFEVFFVV